MSTDEMTREELRDLTATLAALERERAELEGSLRDGLRAIEEAYRASNQDRYAALDDLADRIAEIRDRIRNGAIDIFEETGDKKPVPGVSIRTVTRLEYEERDAILWAIETSRVSGTNQSDLLSIRKRPLEKLMRAHRPSFVEIIEDVQVVFARDLPDLYPSDPADTFEEAAARPRLIKSDDEYIGQSF